MGPATQSNDLRLSASTRPCIYFLYNKTLKCDHNGFKYIIDGHDITVDIPAGAVPEGKIIEFEVGVAVSGPFKFPENVRPISPIIWIHFQDDNVMNEFEKPFQMIIPHCLSGLTRNAYQISLVKAEYDTVTVVEERAKQQYTFIQCKNFANFLVEENCGVLQTNETNGMFSITVALLKNSESVMTNLNYCLAQVNLPPSPPNYEFHFYAIMDLASHKRVS